MTKDYKYTLKGKCIIPGCDDVAPVTGTKLCKAHYERKKRGSSMERERYYITRRMDDIERFERKYMPITESGCWMWTDSISKGGYGAFRVRGKTKDIPAHRWAYEHFIGPIPEGLVIDHKCRVRCCVNPFHLEPVTHAENIKRGFSKREYCYKGHPLTEDNIFIRKDGARWCKTCKDIRTKKEKTMYG